MSGETTTIQVEGLLDELLASVEQSLSDRSDDVLVALARLQRASKMDRDAGRRMIAMAIQELEEASSKLRANSKTVKTLRPTLRSAFTEIRAENGGT